MDNCPNCNYDLKSHKKPINQVKGIITQVKGIITKDKLIDGDIKVLYDESLKQVINDVNIVIIPTEKAIKNRSISYNILLKPTICYASNWLTVEYVKEQLYKSFSETGRTWAGILRGELPTDCHEIEKQLTNEQIEYLYDVGINPLKNAHGCIFIWGQKFINKKGEPDKIDVYLISNAINKTIRKITIKSKNYQSYLNKRTNFIQWLLNTDVITGVEHCYKISNTYIHLIDGHFLTDMKWNTKKEIKEQWIVWKREIRKEHINDSNNG